MTSLTRHPEKDTEATILCLIKHSVTCSSYKTKQLWNWNLKDIPCCHGVIRLWLQATPHFDEDPSNHYSYMSYWIASLVNIHQFISSFISLRFRTRVKHIKDIYQALNSFLEPGSGFICGKTALRSLLHKCRYQVLANKWFELAALRACFYIWQPETCSLYQPRIIHCT